jgi:hypothetical protein
MAANYLYSRNFSIQQAMAKQRGGRGGRPPGRRGSRRGGRPQQGKKEAPASYYMQPGKRGTVVILHRAVGNRVSPKVCGVMPSRPHALALVEQLKRAESALNDLFYEATDDGIEALEAVLQACRAAVLERTPPSESSLTAEEMDGERERIQAELDTRATQDRAAI